MNKLNGSNIKLFIDGVEVIRFTASDVLINNNRAAEVKGEIVSQVEREIIRVRIHTEFHDEMNIVVEPFIGLPPMAEQEVLPWTNVLQIARAILYAQIGQDTTIIVIPVDNEAFAASKGIDRVYAQTQYASELVSNILYYYSAKFAANAFGISQILATIVASEHDKYLSNQGPYENCYR